jgi:gas vesicle protein
VSKKRSRDIAFLAVGIGIGSAIALLLAPGSGEDIRYALGRGYRKTVKNIGRQTEDLRDRAEGLLEHAQSLSKIGAVPHWLGGRRVGRCRQDG